MPKHKIQKQEEISLEDWKQILKLAGKLDFSRAYKVPKNQHWLQAILAIIWLTGKRINEVLQLKRKHISFTPKNKPTQIRIKFFVGKKRSKGSPLELMPFQKARTIKHKAVPYIVEYLDEFDLTNVPDDQLFPANTKSRIKTVKTKFLNAKSEEEVRSYTYHEQGGYVKQQTARFWLGVINKKLPKAKRIYFHYGRHSIGIRLAYQGKTPYQIAAILDETVRSALEYTKHAGGYSQEWTNETE